jgi:threonine/homoserine/homoserine lactone efflux protein
MALLTTLLAGAAFGLALAAPPGPMNAVIAEESVARGWGSGFRAGLGAMTADLLFMLGALLGVVAVIRQVPLLQGGLLAVGGLLMLYFAYGAVTELWSGFRSAGTEGKGFRKAFLLAVTNPYQILFWLTVGVGLLDPGRVDVLAPLSAALAGSVVVETGSPALLTGLFGGIVLWITGFPAALVFAERRVDALAPAVAALSALVLAGFGVFFLYDAARTLL